MSLTVALEDESVQLGERWEELARSTGAGPFLYPGWVTAWRASWGRGQAVALVARRSGDVVGVLPLERRAGSLHSPTNWHTPEFGSVTTDDGVSDELLQSLFSQRARACDLGFVDSENIVSVNWNEKARVTGYRPLTRVLQSSPYVDSSESWDEYEGSRGKKLRTELRRRRRRLEEEGELRVDIHTGNENLDDLLDEGFRIEEAAWKGSEGTAINSDEPTKRFYSEIARWAATRGWLRLAFLRLGDEGLTFDLSLEVDGVHYLIKTGYEPSRRRFAPGMLMRYEMIKRSFESGHKSYEFLGSNNPWKLEWTSKVRNRMLLQAFSPSLTGRLEWAAYAHIRPRAKRLVAAARKKR